MGLLRKHTIFHAEEALPDPEELKLRFRRRILSLTFLGFLVVLGAPVGRELHPELQARVEARHFAEQMVDARTLAARSRQPVSLELLSDHSGWKRGFHLAGENCAEEAMGPSATLPAEGILWKMQAQQETGESVSGKKLCWHPTKGLLLDTLPLANGQLLISLASAQENASSANLAFVLVTHGGAELQTVSR